MFIVRDYNMLVLPHDPWLPVLASYNPALARRPALQLGPHNLPHLPILNEPTLHAIAQAHQMPQLPSPLVTDGSYDWCHEQPFATQKRTAEMLVMHRMAFILSELGTGKTLAALLAIDWLILRGVIKRALVVAPLSTLDSVWRKEIAMRTSRLWPEVLHSHDGHKRLKLFRHSDANVFIINYHGVTSMLSTLVDAEFDLVVVDELATLRHTRNRMWRHINLIAKRAAWRWGLTGAPTPGGPEDAYGEIKLINPAKVPAAFKGWRELVSVPAGPWGWKARPEAMLLVAKAMQPSVRYTRAQVMELPARYVIDQETGISAEQKHAYEQMRRHCLIEYQAGRVTAVNAAVLTGKLLQISCGAVYTETKTTIDLKPRPRLTAVQTLIDAAAGKVIVFAPYRHIVHILAPVLRASAGRVHAVVTGDTPPQARGPLFQSFQDEYSPLGLILAHPQCMAHGLTLTAANTIIWWGAYPSNEIYEQANGRVTRPGQKREQMIVHMMSTPIEKKIFKVLKSRGNMQNTLLKLFEEMMQMGL